MNLKRVLSCAWLLLLTTSLSTQNVGLSLRIAGASTIQSLAQAVAALPAAAVGISVEGGGSGAGVSRVLAGTADIGMVSRSLSASEASQLWYTTIGYDALVFIVNERNPLTSLDLATVRRIFDGSLTEWVGLSGMAGPIIPINKELGRSTLELFEAYAGLLHPSRGRAGSAGVIALNYQIGSNLEMATIVGGLPNAIGYLSLGSAELLRQAGLPIRLLELDGVVPGLDTIQNGRYPIIRELNLVYRSATPAVQAYISLFFEADGIRLLQQAGFVPAERK
ncbi:MAG: hypothetical protein A2087_09685 [Spirochaetes bacterium GWD1_61_31]|nr:MAG: hypothetical protein A2Y37_05500 [Spirochaetes bacterium GWB1_60_80]OHD34374.1 MAG: hypothetical protein A2004_06855 [Spirochaetes bacterium GWC1_61_12]OHD41633.1 MAG: hypothetical protein A2087_09685 [Spirochaetes bacterium GWD1_61_31]OHD41676.1 MAG: hypothetical protein A2Y35_09050 [Spirochaetes bacterium GWE1_60_18]OHD60282.1 MAG: hypothetical protein A2Y32_07025 [Spirochaetes bacterium GWF1_60_12]HAP42920.1 ABC transporter substrate-binding protein [Spirochaetaceae bacterium]